MPVHRPTLSELVAITRESLAAIGEEGTTECRFELRLVMHALEIVAREIAQADAARAVEHAALRRLQHEIVDVDVDDLTRKLDALNRDVCARLEQGRLTPDNPVFLENMRDCVLARLAIDNPRFNGTHDD